jgi:hypothetical protein
MEVVIDDSATQEETRDIADALATETFAEACILYAIEPIGHPDERQIYVRPSGKRSGALISVNEISQASVAKLIGMLR